MNFNDRGINTLLHSCSSHTFIQLQEKDLLLFKEAQQLHWEEMKDKYTPEIREFLLRFILGILGFQISRCQQNDGGNSLIRPKPPRPPHLYTAESQSRGSNLTKT